MQRVVKFEMHSQPYWNNYFNSGRYFNSGCDVKLSLKFILNHYWNNYFNSGRYFNSGCDVMLSLKFILNHYWNNYFNSGRYFNSGCNNAALVGRVLNQPFCQINDPDPRGQLLIFTSVLLREYLAVLFSWFRHVWSIFRCLLSLCRL